MSMYMYQVTKEVLSDFVDSMQSKDLLTSVIGAVRCDEIQQPLSSPTMYLGPIYDPTGAPI